MIRRLPELRKPEQKKYLILGEKNRLKISLFLMGMLGFLKDSPFIEAFVG